MFGTMCTESSFSLRCCQFHLSPSTIPSQAVVRVLSRPSRVLAWLSSQAPQADLPASGSHQLWTIPRLPPAMFSAPMPRVSTLDRRGQILIEVRFYSPRLSDACGARELFFILEVLVVSTRPGCLRLKNTNCFCVWQISANAVIFLRGLWRIFCQNEVTLHWNCIASCMKNLICAKLKHHLLPLCPHEALLVLLCSLSAGCTWHALVFCKRIHFVWI